MKKRTALKATTAFAVGAAAIVVAAPASEASKQFSDVETEHQFAPEIYELSARDIIAGYEDGTFKPGQYVTRAQAAKILAGVLGLDIENVQNPGFTDVDESSSYYGAIAALKEANIISGFGDDTFRPNGTLTRGQMSKILVKGFDLQATDKVAPFMDIEGQYKDMISTLYTLGITTGKTETTYEPASFVTRGQLSAFVVRTERAVKNENQEEVTTITADDTVIVTDVTETTVVTDAGEFAVAEALQPLFAQNEEALQNAELNITVEEGEVVALHKLVLHTSGTAEAPAVFDGGNATLEAELIVDADYVSVQNLILQGNMSVTGVAVNEFSTDQVTVEGDFFVQEGVDNVVASLNVRDVIANLNKQMKFNLKGFKSKRMEVARNNVAIHADVKQPKLELKGNVEKVDLQLPVAELNIAVAGKLEMTGAPKIEVAKIESAVAIVLSIVETITKLEFTTKNVSLELGHSTTILTVNLPEGATLKDLVKNFEKVQTQIERIEGAQPEVTVPSVPSTPSTYTPSTSKSERIPVTAPVYLSNIKKALYFDNTLLEVTGGTLQLTYTGAISIMPTAKLIVRGKDVDGQTSTIEITNLDVQGNNNVYTVQLSKENAQALAMFDFAKDIKLELQGVETEPIEGYAVRPVQVSATTITYDKKEEVIPELASPVALSKVEYRESKNGENERVGGVFSFTYDDAIIIGQNATFTIDGQTASGDAIRIVVPNLDIEGNNNVYEVPVTLEVADKLALLDRTKPYTFTLNDVYTTQADRVQRTVHVSATQLDMQVAPDTVTLTTVYADVGNNRVLLQFSGEVGFYAGAELVVEGLLEGETLDTVTIQNLQVAAGYNNVYAIPVEAEMAQKLASMTNVKATLTGVVTAQEGTFEQAVTVAIDEIEQYVHEPVALTNVKPVFTRDEEHKATSVDLQFTYNGDIEITEDATFEISGTDMAGLARKISVQGLAAAAGSNNVYTVKVPADYLYALDIFDYSAPVEFTLSGVMDVTSYLVPTPVKVKATAFDYTNPPTLKSVSYVKDVTTSEDTIQLTFDSAVELQSAYDFSIGGVRADGGEGQYMFFKFSSFVAVEGAEHTYRLPAMEAEVFESITMLDPATLQFNVKNIMDPHAARPVRVLKNMIIDLPR